MKVHLEVIPPDRPEEARLSLWQETETRYRLSALLEEEAAKLQEKHPDLVHFVRNIGMSMGIGICRTLADGTKEEDGVATFKILFRCYELGLIVISLAGHILRIQPPLIIEADQIRQGFSIISQAMDDFKAGRISDDVLQYQAGW